MTKDEKRRLQKLHKCSFLGVFDHVHLVFCQFNSFVHQFVKLTGDFNKYIYNMFKVELDTIHDTHTPSEVVYL